MVKLSSNIQPCGTNECGWTHCKKTRSSLFSRGILLMKENTNRLVVISYRLPFHVEEGALKQNSGGLVSAMLSYAKGKTNETNIYSLPTKVVWAVVSNDSIEDHANAKRDEDQYYFEMIPRQLDEEMQQSYYA